MIKIHHLGVSQSDRVVWLMEELGLPYELVWYDRGPDMLAPPEYRALHPAGTAPIIEDGDVVLCESAAIVEYIIQRELTQPSVSRARASRSAGRRLRAAA